MISLCGEILSMNDQVSLFVCFFVVSHSLIQLCNTSNITNQQLCRCITVHVYMYHHI